MFTKIKKFIAHLFNEGLDDDLDAEDFIFWPFYAFWTIAIGICAAVVLKYVLFGN